jgi:hypothetical protein
MRVTAEGLAMNQETLQSRDQIAATYLQQMQELASEISVGMDAIAANKLPNLQDSVSRQEMLCSSLATMANVVSEGFRSPGAPSPSSIDPSIERKIQAAGVAIQELNLQYAALLRHSGKSIALLSLLCNSITGQFQEARGPRLKHQTWSCEM